MSLVEDKSLSEPLVFAVLKDSGFWVPPKGTISHNMEGLMLDGNAEDRNGTTERMFTY